MEARGPRRVGKIAYHGENIGDGIGGDFADAVEFDGSAARAAAKVPLPTLRAIPFDRNPL